MNNATMQSFSYEIEKSASIVGRVVRAVTGHDPGVIGLAAKQAIGVGVKKTVRKRPGGGIMKTVGNFLTSPVEISPKFKKTMTKAFPTFTDIGKTITNAEHTPNSATGRVVRGVGGVAKDVATAGVVGTGAAAVGIGAGVGQPSEFGS